MDPTDISLIRPIHGPQASASSSKAGKREERRKRQGRFRPKPSDSEGQNSPTLDEDDPHTIDFCA